ncbi:MAG: DNA mismatch repair protein MutS, partial [Oscillospiraceae bacterium]|nr:DNA mismatch repair protein MutS [Oscillospiraceae bacterium]
MAEALTPMMKQYYRIKEENPDCLLFFRLGDFYEMFHEDAKIAARELDLTLTTRDRNKPEEERVPMCGVPYHSVQAYLSRLIAKGYKVGICEQMEDPALAKGLVERELIHIITPGTVIDETMLDEGRNNYICAVYQQGDRGGLSVCDISTGECFAAAYSGPELTGHLINELCRFSPREAMLSDGAFENGELLTYLQTRLECRCERGGEERFSPEKAGALVDQQFPARQADAPAEAVQATGALLSYLYQTQKTDLSYISKLTFGADAQYMELDPVARSNLELTETLRSKEKKGSLLWVLDKTHTAMGRRLIRTWLERPLLDPEQINRRLDAVEELVGDAIGRDELALCLRGITDLERLIGRIVYGSAGGRDLAALARGLEALPAVQTQLGRFHSPLLTSLAGQIDPLPGLCSILNAALVDEPPLSVREGGLIRPGWDKEADRLRHIQTDGKSMVASIEARERERTGIKNLKVGFNKVFGYYIEVSKANYALVPEDYIRKQTLANCERFITQELKDLEQEILSAQDRLTALEYQLFCQLRETACKQAEQIQRTAAAVGQIDVLLSFALTASANRYCRPQVDLSDRLEITEGRHPVVEQMLTDAPFVPNDTVMDGEDNLLAIITGPNMAGKSTYMRQVALIALMAQIGSFVPAKRAHVGVIDRVFTRIGASDNLAAGASTFMVEMTEVAQLLKHATPRSLLILDEIGRGTSTYDGMAIARAVLEYCADRERLGCKTLFATHYHELTALEGQLPGVKNYNISAKKREKDIVFLRKIVPGGAQASYGIEVAQLAGVPEQVIHRARAILQELSAQGWVPQAPQAEPTPAGEDGQAARLAAARRGFKLTGTPRQA